MMSNIIRKTNIVLLLLILLCSCSENSSNKVTFFYQKKKVSCSFDIINFKNANYVRLSNSEILKSIEENVVDSIQMNFKKNIFEGQPINIMSSEYKESDFLFPVNNKNHIDLVNIKKKKMFTIVVMNEKMKVLANSAKSSY